MSATTQQPAPTRRGSFTVVRPREHDRFVITLTDAGSPSIYFPLVTSVAEAAKAIMRNMTAAGYDLLTPSFDEWRAKNEVWPIELFLRSLQNLRQHCA